MRFIPGLTNFFIQEVPDEISLGIYISGCGLNCKNCNMKYLQNENGVELHQSYLEWFIDKYQGEFSNVIFFGGDNYEEDLIKLLQFLKSKSLKTTLYTGRDNVSEKIKNNLDFLKIGEYKEELGGLRNKTTNQRLFDLSTETDITYKFWK